MHEINPKVKKLFICRAVCWFIALASTLYWIIWSFKIYIDAPTISVDEHYYASILRPKFYAGVLIAAFVIIVSFKLRSISDKIKKEEEMKFANN